MNRIITDPNELATIDLKILLDAVKPFCTSEEIEAYAKAGKETRRGVVVQYYIKYIQKGEGAKQETKNDETKDEKPEDKDKGSVFNTGDNNTSTVSVPDNNHVQDEKHFKGMSIEDYAVAVIRNVPGYNGAVTLQVSRIVEMVFKYTDGTFEFKSPDRAGAFIGTIQGMKKIKGIYDLTDAKKAAVIKRIAAFNKVALKEVTEDNKV